MTDTKAPVAKGDDPAPDTPILPSSRRSAASMTDSEAPPTARDAEEGRPVVGQAAPHMMLEVQEEYVPCFFRYVTAITRAAGIVTIIVLWVITGHMLGTQEGMGTRQWYMISLSTAITLFECMWVINKCAQKCKNDSCICHCWSVCVWLDNWKKTIFYTCISVPCFVAPIVNAKTIIAASLVLVTAFFYFLRSFKASSCVVARRKKLKEVPYATTSGDKKASLVNQEVQTSNEDPQPSGSVQYQSTDR